MRITVIPTENKVYIDGVCKYKIDLSGMDQTIRAIQWNGDSGRVEYMAS